MDKLILQPTSLAQWYTLVNEAQHYTSLELGEELESYLVFLLMRFADQPQLANSVLALDFLQGITTMGSLRHEALKEVGDKCLLFSGLFPERAIKRRVTVSYFVDLGQTAYGTLSDQAGVELAKLFSKLCDRFLQMKSVLGSMREISSQEKKNSEVSRDPSLKYH